MSRAVAAPDPDLTAAPAVCRVCGCSDAEACPSGCAWYDPTLCTTCALAVEAVVEWIEEAHKPDTNRLMREVGLQHRRRKEGQTHAAGG